MKQASLIQIIDPEEFTDSVRMVIREELTAILQGQQKATGTGELLSAEEAAEFTKRSLATIYRQVSNREIPFHKNGNRLFFFKAELIDWITNRSK